ncbi:hypothetical protein GUITHDRAFT_138503 [Guillardia theta CCMP2712]|uniref:Zinc/iron permease n=1 Tax=Guillardia theta (strain CCMP2712) TaxID=905079 RepID=L1JBW8_GUITC|nr:hypothetical protein GUITHDRAFT_138503 [Guillardia theta CCMP2712]EKX46016.1 hypothetical protein GUITHDRAFT_138503 [Guillardia theta CCMP2712]|eukprot:XP_005832996.1 hypothetical protein GUITHDRAFT_138503 [Guillardia theta CCMP2712]
MAVELLEFKIFALSAVMLTSLAGVLPPILRPGMGKGGAHPSYWFFLMRSFTAGVMLSLAFVHIISEAFEVMDGLCGKYPIASVFVMSGLVLMICVERGALDFMSRNDDGHGHQMSSQEFVCCQSDMHQHSHGCIRHAHHNSSDHTQPLQEKLMSRCCKGLVPGSHLPAELEDECAEEDGSGESHQEHSHDHAEIQQESKRGDLESDLLEGGKKPKPPELMLGMLEVGVIMHSLIIGMDLGVMSQRPSAIVGLVVALCFHQFFEGLGLGTCISYVVHDSRSRISKNKLLIMVSSFALTFPLGVASGIVFSTIPTFRPGSEFQRWIQGSLDGISGGILVYLGLVHFIAGTLMYLKEPPGETYARFARDFAVSIDPNLDINQSFKRVISSLPPLDYSNLPEDEEKVLEMEKAWWKEAVSQVVGEEAAGSEHAPSKNFDGYFEALFHHFGKGTAWALYADRWLCWMELKEEQVTELASFMVLPKSARALKPQEEAFAAAVRAADEVWGGENQSSRMLRCLHVGDSIPCDVEGALRCGIHAVCVDRKGKHSDGLPQYPSEQHDVVADLSKVPEIAERVHPRILFSKQQSFIKSLDDIS